MEAGRHTEDTKVHLGSVRRSIYAELGRQIDPRILGRKKPAY